VSIKKGDMMGKYINVLGGIVLILAALGIQALITLIEGAIPPMLGMLGLILLFIGLEEMKSESVAAAAPPAPMAPPVPEVKEPVYTISHTKKRKR
jgi:cadmium resistance protein CadD (predicted permease)